MDTSKLAQRRQAVGLGQTDLARLVGVDRITVWRWERRNTRPIPMVAKVVEDALARLEAKQATFDTRVAAH